jgi:hypothetical protein
VLDETKAFGRKANIQIIKPNNCFQFDETGGNTCMTKDGHYNGTKFLTRRGDSVKILGSECDNHFTTLTVSSFSGEAVLCLMIFKGTKRSRETETGIDPFPEIPLNTDKDAEYTPGNSTGKGTTFPSGPTCYFNDVEIPTMCRWSEHGGVTPKILTDVFRELDKSGAVERNENTTPFVLLDGHQSRFCSIDFLSYINDESHKWAVCIGLPYGVRSW